MWGVSSAVTMVTQPGETDTHLAGRAPSTVMVLGEWVTVQGSQSSLCH